MTLVLAEGLVNAIIDYLKAHFPDKVAALNDEFADDDITLETPAAYYAGEQSLASIPSYPAIFVLIPRTNIPRYRTGDYVQAIHEAVVGIIVIDQDSEVLRRKLYRYIRAIVELLIEAQPAGMDWALGSGGSFQLDYSPIYTNGDVMAADAQILASIQKRVMEAL